MGARMGARTGARTGAKTGARMARMFLQCCLNSVKLSVGDDESRLWVLHVTTGKLLDLQRRRDVHDKTLMMRFAVQGMKRSNLLTTQHLLGRCLRDLRTRKKLLKRPANKINWCGCNVQPNVRWHEPWNFQRRVQRSGDCMSDILTGTLLLSLARVWRLCRRIERF